MEERDLTAQQALRNRMFIEAAVCVQKDGSSESAHAYINALANVTFLCPVRKSEAGVEFYVTHYGGDAAPLVPVFTSVEEYQAFGSIIPSGYGAEVIPAVAMCQIAIDGFLPTAMLAINPAQPGFLRVPPDLIRIVAASEWRPNDPT